MVVEELATATFAEVLATTGIVWTNQSTKTPYGGEAVLPWPCRFERQQGQPVPMDRSVNQSPLR